MKKLLLFIVLAGGFVYGEASPVYSDSIRILKTDDTTYIMVIYGIVTVEPGTVVDSSKTITSDSIIISLCFNNGGSFGGILHINDTVHLGNLNSSTYSVSLHMANSDLINDDCSTTIWQGTTTFNYSVTAIFEITIQVGISPNPATGFITIQSESNLPPQTTFQLYDITGRMVLQKQLSGEKTTLPLNEISKGLYVYTVTSLEKKMGSGKLVVQ